MDTSRPVLFCWLLRLLELVFKVSAAGEEIVYIESTAWVSVQAATRILQRRYVRDKHNQTSVLKDVFGGELLRPTRDGGYTIETDASLGETDNPARVYVRLERGLFDYKVQKKGKCTMPFYEAVGNLMLHEILVYLDTSIDEQCPLQPETDVLSYRSPESATKNFISCNWHR